jgi:hypothetical protein
MSRKYLLILLLSIFLAAFMLGGFFLPSKTVVTNEVIIDKTPEQIYPFLIDLQQWQHWSIWSQRIDATMQIEFPSATEMKWTAQHAGSGSMKITHALLDSELQTLLSLQNGNFELPGVFRLQIMNEKQTKITWSNTIHSGNNPFRRYLSFSVEGVVKRDIGECMKGLEKFISSQPAS